MRNKLLFVIMLSLGGIGMANAEQQLINNINPNSTILLDELKYGKGMISIGQLNTSYTETIKLKPDVNTFSVTYLTEGDTPNDASNRNANNMKKFKDYLAELGIKDDDLTTVGYKNYEQDKMVSADESSDQYKSNFTVNLNINQQQFFEVVKLLDANNISNVKQDSYTHLYVFNINSIAKSAEKAKSLTQDKYKSISNQLQKIGIKDISVSDYSTDSISPKQVSVKKYYVINTIQIKNNNFDNTGKIIAKAQELKMMVNNDMSYSVSETAKDTALAQYEQVIYSKLAEKATRLLGQQYQLGVPLHLTSSENSNIYDVRPMGYNYNMRSVVNAGQSQLYQADDIDIEAPSEFKLTLIMSGTFEIVKHVKTSN